MVSKVRFGIPVALLIAFPTCLSIAFVLEFPQFCPQNSQLDLLIIHNFQKMPKI